MIKIFSPDAQVPLFVQGSEHLDVDTLKIVRFVSRRFLSPRKVLVFDLHLWLGVSYDDEPGHRMCQLNHMRLVISKFGTGGKTWNGFLLGTSSSLEHGWGG